jgi:diacylglycerol kinase (ATP)
VTTLAILLNENAGRAADVEAAVDRASRDGDFRLVRCGSSGEMREALQRTVEDGAKRVAIAGGDGTASGAARAVIDDELDVELAIIPAGTGNDLARSLGAPMALARALELARDGEARAIDALEVEGVKPTLCINAVTARTCTEGEDEPESKEWLGRASYWIETLSDLASAEPFRVRLRTETVDTELEAHGLAICNGRTAGGGTPVAPEAMLDDGRLEVAFFPKQPLGRALMTALSVAVGGAAGEVVRLREKSVALDCKERVLVSVDGEVSRASRIAATVKRGALRMVVGPAGAVER